MLIALEQLLQKIIIVLVGVALAIASTSQVSLQHDVISILTGPSRILAIASTSQVSLQLPLNDPARSGRIFATAFISYR